MKMYQYFIEAPVKAELEENLKKVNIDYKFATPKEDASVPSHTFGLWIPLERDEMVRILPEDYENSDIIELPRKVAFNRWERLAAMRRTDGGMNCMFTIC